MKFDHIYKAIYHNMKYRLSEPTLALSLMKLLRILLGIVEMFLYDSLINQRANMGTTIGLKGLTKIKKDQMISTIF